MCAFSVDGGYGEWKASGSCTKECGGGEQVYTRACDKPAPAQGGSDCSGLGAASDTRLCNTHSCPGMYQYYRCNLSMQFCMIENERYLYSTAHRLALLQERGNCRGYSPLVVSRETTCISLLLPQCYIHAVPLYLVSVLQDYRLLF